MERPRRLIGEIREKCGKLEEPVRYLNGIGSVHSELPGSIVLLQRNREHRIYRTPQPLQLLHGSYVLTVSLQEEGLICAAEHTYRLPEGGASVVYPFQGHHYMVEQENFFWLVVTFGLANAYLPDFMFRSFELSPFAWQLLGRVVDLYLELLPGPQDRVREGLLQSTLYAFLLELRLGNEVGEARPGGDSAPPRRHRVEVFEAMNRRIIDGIADPELSVSSLSAEFGVSVPSMYQLFQLLVGCNPGEYIRTLRIKRAIKLLNANDMLIADVAENSGFTSQAIFSRCFRKVIGCSPSEYLRQHRE